LKETLMLKVAAFSVTSSLLILGACGGNSPQDECDKIASVACSKLYQCVDATTIKTTFGFQSQSDCESTYRTTLKCATAKDNCPAGTTYDGNAADQCVNDYNNLACNQVGNTTPVSCNQNAICK
jgi:hypothetical protein